MTPKTMAEVLGELWDLGNATGLDGWIGPGRGAGEVDDYAVEVRRRDVEKAEAALSAAGFGLVADAKAEAKRYAAAAGVRAVCDVWGAGGRATVRLSELSEIAKDITEGEWDQHIEWNLKDIARERARATKAAS